MDLVIALVAGLGIGISLGALGAGGSILAVPVLVYALGETPVQATTGSLVVVGSTAVIGGITAYRRGNVLLGQGLTFGALAIGGAAVGARLSTQVDEDVLLAAFAVLMLVVGGLMLVRQLRGRQPEKPPHLDGPILSVSPEFHCNCPQLLKLLVTATVVGLMTGFLGVGGGFLVVPALVLALGLPMRYAAGTSLVVIAMTSASALAVRVGSGVQPEWAEVLLLTAASGIGAVIGARLVSRVDAHRLAGAFTALVLAVAIYTATQAFPALA